MNSSLKINGDIRENVLVKLIGSTDISSIGSTVTGAISNLDTKIVQMKNDINNSIKTQLNQMDTKLTEVSTSLNSTITDKIKPIENKIGTSNYSGVGSTISQSLVNLKNSINTCNSNINSLPLKIYPVGAIYISTSSTNPAALFGGSWVRISDAFLMAAGNTYPAGTSGGSNSVSLAANQIPSLGISGTTNASTTGSAGSGMSASSSVSSYGYSDRQGSTSENGEHDHASMKDNALIYVTTPAGGTTPGSAVSGGVGAPNFWSNTKTSINGSHSHTVYYRDYYANGISTTVSGLTPHTHTMPALTVNGSYTNNNLQSINVTNKYITVYMWKRVS